MSETPFIEPVSAPVGASRRAFRRRTLIITGLVLIVVMVTAGVVALKGERFSLVLTEEQIQQRLDARFPVTKRYLLVIGLTFSEPKVELAEGSDRIGFGVTTAVNLTVGGATKPLGGRAAISSGLRYDPQDFSFYLDDPRIESLHVQGIPVAYIEQVNEGALALAQERINRTKIHTLRPDQFQQAAARLVLKEVTVTDGRLVITLGL